MYTMRRRALILGFLLFLGAALIRVGGTLAHARLLRAEPPPGSVVKTPPAVVRLWFALAPNEELDPRRCTLSVWDRQGRRVDDGKGGVDLNDLDRRTMVARLKPIGPGTYTVRWKAVTAPDRGASQGSFRFTVAPSKTP
ncbi:MAG: copper resistance protein CopC [Armatimonadota bacterium]|nr:copper resistance protein CopC [Armatimonadota bacterium]